MKNFRGVDEVEEGDGAAFLDGMGGEIEGFFESQEEQNIAMPKDKMQEILLFVRFAVVLRFQY